MKMSYKGTPASSQIIWLEQRVEQLESGPGGIMEMKQTIADKEQRIEKLENQFKLYFHAFNKAAVRISELETALRTIYDCCDETGNCSVVRRIARKALEGKDE
jgi:hypothetical protein